MAKKRKETESFILEHIKSLTPGSDFNLNIYKERFKSMSDLEFDRFMTRLNSGQENLILISPNHANDGLSLENNFKVGDKLKHNFFSKLMVVNMPGVPDHYTPVEYMVVDLPVRRLSQTSDKKISVPKNNKVIDSLTGQVTGESRGAAISFPELRLMSGMGLEHAIIELIKYRGGDKLGRTALNGLISKYGNANMDTLSKYQSGVQSTLAIRTFLTAAMLRNNL